MKNISKLLVGFSFALPVLFLLLSKAGTADTMDKMKALENTEIATLAGGCFWCTESDLEQLTGVVDVVSGYSGGHIE
ncbi:peptide-methionine (S)-S-oxide reductase, partial [Vibrio sp. 1078-1]|uniref:peptide-methionine (S)-S-oxide reductase n=1 Tax=Vibrio sp. 1078-1 TaxID=3074544 RepID=UPI002964038C